MPETIITATTINGEMTGDTNIQGDVVAIVNSSGTTVVSYTYDAWGNILTTTGSVASTLGETNPLRYRGYIYDRETGLYYLQSRYYDPSIGRFLNADGLVSTGQGVLGNNMFAYCMSNPVNMFDSEGCCSRFLIFKIDCYKASCETSINYIAPKCVAPAGTYMGGNGFVFIVKPDQLEEISCNLEPNAVIVVDYRMNANDEYDQNIRIMYSCRITNKSHQKEIIDVICKYNKDNPVSPGWNRSPESMLTEWEAHNHGYFLAPFAALLLSRHIAENCRHVDFNNNDEELTYFDYYKK